MLFIILALTVVAFVFRYFWQRKIMQAQIEQERKDKERQEELNQMKIHFFINMSHELRTPLTLILAPLHEVLARIDDQWTRTQLKYAQKSGQKMLRLVNQLMNYRQAELGVFHLKVQKGNVCRLISDTFMSFERLARSRKIDYNLYIEINDDEWIFDARYLELITNNLLSNAVKFTSKGEITFSVSYSSSRLHIDVTDTGKGMAAKDRERIFQEFTRLPGAQGEEGFGLGLSIVHKLVTLLEGTIDVRSVVGEGSTFTVILPLYPVGKALSDYKDKKQSVINNTNTVPAAEEDEGTQLPVPAANILLIDDDKIQLTLTAAMLEQQGIHATCCEQLDELTEQLRENHFDVLLTDVQMPAINGFDLLKLLRASNIPQAKTIPIIAVTARSDMNEAEFLEHGFAGCLHKPFTVKELIQLTIDSGQLTVESGQLRVDSEQLTVKEEPLVCSTVAQPTVNCQLSIL